MKNKQKRTKNSYLYIIFLALAFIILLGTGAYAYYQTTISGTITGTVARWSFKVNNQTSTFNLDFGSLYPGKTGTYNLELSAEDSDLPVVFEVIYHYPNQTTTAGQLKTHALFKPLCFPAAYGDPIDSIQNADCHINNFEMKNRFSAYVIGYKGVIQAGATATVPIGYNWPYDLVSDDDQTLQGYVTGETVNLEVTIIGRQVDISSNEAFITSAFTTDLLRLRSNSSCSTNNNYGYPCIWKYMDYFYYVALEEGLVEGDLNAELENLASWFFILIHSFIIEGNEFSVVPIFGSFYEPSGT